MKLNLPNKITLFRFVVSFFLFILLVILTHQRISGLYIAAFALFMVGAFSDFLDGYIARKYKLVTRFGSIVDPFADKVLVCGTFIMMIDLSDFITGWYVLVIVIRELGITALRAHMESLGTAFPAKMPGKIKMLGQCMAIPAVLVYEAFAESMSEALATGWEWLMVILLGITLFFTIYSGIAYLFIAFRLLKNNDPHNDDPQ